MKEPRYIHHSEYFYGNKISDYGLQNGYVDYATLAKSFDAVLNNNIIEMTSNIGYWEPVNGFEEDEDGNLKEIFQFYIISDAGAQILMELTNELVMYNNILDMYCWCIDHWGSSWSIVLTEIRVELNNT